ncbi:hypothetical protein NPIL_22061 [Nephila pilipes]|uniref:Uncharacterized protein n=1 Tax=Nephila pilipes TaxID=299642 RepID=A0A8X6N0H1_NEPPI|nr:hypothetical protein NPIL_22061 [Nephila pilipes]
MCLGEKKAIPYTSLQFFFSIVFILESADQANLSRQRRLTSLRECGRKGGPRQCRPRKAITITTLRSYLGSRAAAFSLVWQKGGDVVCWFFFTFETTRLDATGRCLIES